MTEEEYDALPGLRWTLIREMYKSPLHYHEAWKRRTHKRDTRSLRLGRAIHCALLEGEDVFRSRYACFTGKRRAGKAWDAFLAAHQPPTEIVTPGEMSHALSSAAAIRRHGVAERFLGGATEEMVRWEDQETGLACKARLDLVTTDYHVELKSTDRLGVQQFGRTAANMGYHLQVAFHYDGLLANGWSPGPLRNMPIMIVVEQSPPFDVIVFRMPEVVLDAGRTDYHKLLRRIADCDAMDRWPGREPSEVVELQIPEWALPDSELTLDGENVFGD